MVYIGIDISKSSFVAAYPSVNGYRTQTYPVSYTHLTLPTNRLV